MGWNAYRFRKAVRDYLGFERIGAQAKAALIDWLIDHPIMHHEHDVEAMMALARRELWEHQIEPPRPQELYRLVRSAVVQFETAFFAEMEQALPDESKAALDALIATDPPDNETEQAFRHSDFLFLKLDPNRVGTASLMDEIHKLDILLCLYGLGTNIGIKGVSKGEHGESYRDILHVMLRFIHPDGIRQVAAEVTNATFAIRQPHIWGEGTTHHLCLCLATPPDPR